MAILKKKKKKSVYQIFFEFLVLFTTKHSVAMENTSRKQMLPLVVISNDS